MNNQNLIMNHSVGWATDLNPAQYQAVIHGSGPLLIVAGPGTGKTRILSSKIGHLIETGAAKPDQILAITFTNQAANEIFDRVFSMLYEKLPAGYRQNEKTTPRVNTFHGWALRFLKEILGPEARILINERDAHDLCREATRGLGLTNTKRQDFYSLISEAKQQFPPNIEGHKDVEAVYIAYQALLEKYLLWDYDDLILEAIRLLESAEIKEKFHKDFPFILVDEFQDISPAQYELIKSMARKDGNITVIGDPNQAIYGFRSASPEFIHSFNLDFENVKIITLDIVYRCPQHFLDAATNIVKDRSDNKLRSVKKATPRIKIRSFKNPTEEAKWVTKTIEQMVGGLSFVSLDSGAADGHELRSLSDIAILFRARALGDAVAESLSKRGIPVQRMDTPEPLAQKELRSIWRVWEILKGRATQFHLTKLQEEENIQSKKLFDIKSHSQNKDGPQLLDHIIDILGLDPQKPLIRALAHVIKKHPYSDSLAVLLRNEADLMDINIEAVSLLSIHAAKGLEFPIIFLIGCEAGILPWKDADRQEERRLFYVGLTRASENIYISYVKQRRLFGQFMQNGPSPFIDDIPEKFLLKEQTPRTKTLQRPRQKKLF